MKGNLLFSCTVFCPVWFFFIVVLSDTLTFICEETCNIVTVHPFKDLWGCTLSDMCLVWFRKPPSTLFAVYRTGFLTCSCAVKDAVLFDSGLTESLLTKWRGKKNKVHAALDLIKVSDRRTEGLLDSQLIHWISLWLWASCIISLSMWVSWPVKCNSFIFMLLTMMLFGLTDVCKAVHGLYEKHAIEIPNYKAKYLHFRMKAVGSASLTVPFCVFFA